MSLGGDLLVEAEVLFDGGDADFKLESLVDFVFLELQLGVEAFDVVLVAISLRRSVMSSLVANAGRRNRAFRRVP